MGEYLVRCLPSYPTREAALEGALKQMGLCKVGKPQGMAASMKQREAHEVWVSNLRMSKYFPPLPDHMKQQRIDADLDRYAKYLSRGVVSDPYRDIPDNPLGGRKVYD